MRERSCQYLGVEGERRERKTNMKNRLVESADFGEVRVDVKRVVVTADEK
jgi:hypothetical protein